jgi:hypothetical protein
MYKENKRIHFNVYTGGRLVRTLSEKDRMQTVWMFVKWYYQFKKMRFPSPRFRLHPLRSDCRIAFAPSSSNQTGTAPVSASFANRQGSPSLESFTRNLYAVKHYRKRIACHRGRKMESASLFLSFYYKNNLLLPSRQRERK